MAAELRPAGLDGLPQVEALARRIWPFAFREILSEDQIEYMLQRMYSQSALREQVLHQANHFLLLWAEDEPIGYVSYQLDYLPGTAKLHKLYLLPEQHGHGLGRHMIDTVRDIARQAGQGRLRLDVNYQNKAVDFYKHYGFDIVERVDTDIGQGYLMEDYVMEMTLN